ncbi:alpha/beta hydrolase [Microlunatus spumicola]|uniref:Alpha/beta hydrolase n=1 Tax=Microlunatus spumicola TaxID=81499 RepID=A0ABP6XD27_9ACTN
MPNVTRAGRGPLTVVDHQVPTGDGVVRLRGYRPSGASGALPAHVLIHGGSYWAGSVESYGPLCAWYARTVPCQVFSVDYRLAPEHPFPAGLEDCYAALVHVAEHAGALGVDLARLSVGGVSAGGGLAAAVALLARDRSGPALRLQLLEIPMLDPTMRSRSLDTYAEGFGIGRADVATGWGHYLAGGTAGLADAYAGPSAAADLTGLPPAAVLTAGCDPLRDEGEAYAARLRDAGVPVETYRAHGHVHSSHYLTKFLPSARRAVGWSTDALRRAYA